MFRPEESSVGSGPSEVEDLSSAGSYSGRRDLPEGERSQD